MKLNTWIAVQVKFKQELTVSSTLEGKGYETFVPTYLTVRQWSDRRKVVELPLITGYVFVRSGVEVERGPVATTPGVIRMVGFGKQVATIADAEIERLRTIAKSSLVAEPWSYLAPGTEVRINRGALTGIAGRVLQVRDKTLLVVSIEILQRSVAVHIDRSWIDSSDGIDLPLRDATRYAAKHSAA